MITSVILAIYQVSVNQKTNISPDILSIVRISAINILTQVFPSLHELFKSNFCKLFSKIYCEWDVRLQQRF